MARDDVERYSEQELEAETVGNQLLMGFWRGMREKARQYAEIFERLLTQT